MATGKQTKPLPELTLIDGVYVARYPRYTFRFLFEDGTTVDVVAYHDTGDLRTALVKEIGGKAVIVGVAQLTPPD